jgi:hypothetical protein
VKPIVELTTSDLANVRTNGIKLWIGQLDLPAGGDPFDYQPVGIDYLLTEAEGILATRVSASAADAGPTPRNITPGVPTLSKSRTPGILEPRACRSSRSDRSKTTACGETDRGDQPGGRLSLCCLSPDRV